MNVLEVYLNGQIVFVNQLEWIGSSSKQFPQTYLIASLNSVKRDPKSTKGELGSNLMLVSDKNIHVPLKELCEKITF